MPDGGIPSSIEAARAAQLGDSIARGRAAREAALSRSTTSAESFPSSDDPLEDFDEEDVPLEDEPLRSVALIREQQQTRARQAQQPSQTPTPTDSDDDEDPAAQLKQDALMYGLDATGAGDVVSIPFTIYRWLARHIKFLRLRGMIQPLRLPAPLQGLLPDVTVDIAAVALILFSGIAALISLIPLFLIIGLVYAAFDPCGALTFANHVFGEGLWSDILSSFGMNIICAVTS